MAEQFATHFKLAGRAVNAATWAKTAFQPANLLTTINLAASGKLTREFGWNFLAQVKDGIYPALSQAHLAERTNAGLTKIRQEMAFCWPDKAAYSSQPPADKSRALELVNKMAKQHPDVECPWLEEAKTAAGHRDTYLKNAGRALLLTFTEQGKVQRAEINHLLTDNAAQARIDEILAFQLSSTHTFESVRMVVALRQELHKLSAAQNNFKPELVAAKMTALSDHLDAARKTKLPEETFIQEPLNVEATNGQGRSFAQYELVGYLGEGGMGRVFTARRLGDEVKDRLFVVKVLLPELISDMENVLLKEGATITQVEHKGIVKGHGTGHVLVTEGKPKQPFIVMEKHDMSLKQALAAKDLLTLEQKLFVLREVIEALRYTWETRQILHRDIKPDNILLNFGPDGGLTAVKVADFGLSKSLSDIDKDGLTVTGRVMGTTGFMAPEVAHIVSKAREGGQREAALKESGEKTDIYQLGNLAYRMFLKRTPPERDFTGNEGGTRWWRFAYAKGEDLKAYTLVKPSDTADVPSRVWNFILKTMEIDPAKRVQTWAAVSEAAAKLDRTEPEDDARTEMSDTPLPQPLFAGEEEALKALRVIRTHLWKSEPPELDILARYNGNLLAMLTLFPDSRDVADWAGPALGQINKLLGGE